MVRGLLKPLSIFFCGPPANSFSGSASRQAGGKGITEGTFFLEDHALCFAPARGSTSSLASIMPLAVSWLLADLLLCLLKQPYCLFCLIEGKRDTGRRPYQLTVIGRMMKPEIDHFDAFDAPNGYQQFLSVSVVDLSYKHKAPFYYEIAP
jgi:hypothetical protein